MSAPGVRADVPRAWPGQPLLAKSRLRALGNNNRILGHSDTGSPTHGEQEGSSYNGHFGCTCYHPLFVFNQFARLRGPPVPA